IFEEELPENKCECNHPQRYYAYPQGLQTSHPHWQMHLYPEKCLPSLSNVGAEDLSEEEECHAF
ncbi:hypothetical protein Tco_0350500, partial [Tanacetum coccineum]